MTTRSAVVGRCSAASVTWVGMALMVVGSQAMSPSTSCRNLRIAVRLSSLTTLFTGAGGNGMKASPGTVLGTDTTPTREAFGCNTLTRTPD